MVVSHLIYVIFCIPYNAYTTLIRIIKENENKTQNFEECYSTWIHAFTMCQLFPYIQVSLAVNFLDIYLLIIITGQTVALYIFYASIH